MLSLLVVIGVELLLTDAVSSTPCLAPQQAA
jgi:hypothetical protein